MEIPIENAIDDAAARVRARSRWVPARIGVSLAACLWACGALAQTQYVVSAFAGAVNPPAGVTATSVSIGQPRRMMLDGAGNLYYGRNASVFKLDRSGNLTVAAGNGAPGCAGDGTAATAAQLTQPTGLAMDSAGVLYIADPGCQAIRKIDTHGTISTLASGTGSQFTGLGGMAIDSSGNLYVAEARVASSNGTYAGFSYVLKVSPGGTVTVAAGNGLAGYAGDGQPAAQAQLNDPADVALDGFGNLFIADSGNARVRMMSQQGIISTFAGTGTVAGSSGVAIAQDSGDGGPAQSASLNFPSTLATGAGGVYMGTRSGVVRAVLQGNISTIAGSATGSTLAAGLPVSSVQIGASGPAGLAVAGDGTIYAAAQCGIWKLPPGGTVSQLAGNGFCSYYGDGVASSMAQFGNVASLARDTLGGILFVDLSNNVVRRIAPNGTVATVAGTGKAGSGFPADGTPAVKADLTLTGPVATDPLGNFYFAASTVVGPCVLKVSPKGELSTVAGRGASRSDDAPAAESALNPVWGLAVGSTGIVYISTADPVFGTNPAIRKVTTDGVIHTLAQISNPGPIAVDPSGNVYAVSYPSASSYRIVPPGPVFLVRVAPSGVVTSFAGGPAIPGDGGLATNAKITTVGQMTFDATGNMYFSDSGRIRKIDTQGIITTIAGTGQPGYSGDGGPALSARTYGGSGIALDASGNIYFGENYDSPLSGVIRVLKPQTATGPTISAVASAASNLTGPVAPGEIVVVYGSKFGPTQGVSNAPDGNGVYGGVVAETSVLFNGKPGPMIYSYPGQAAAVVPYGVSGSTVQIAVQYQGATGAAVTVPVTAANPALLTTTNGKGQAAALNQDGTLNGPGHPALIGSVVVLFATGEGQTLPAGVDGHLTGANPPAPVLPVTVTIGGKTANVQYAGEAPGEIAGLMQLNVQIPSGIETGNSVPVVVRVGNAASPDGVTIAVQ